MGGDRDVKPQHASENVWAYAQQESRRRAVRAATAAPAGILTCVPMGLDPRHPGLHGWARAFVVAVSIVQESMSDVPAAVRSKDPIVLCGRVVPSEHSETEEMLAAGLGGGTHSVFTFGYELGLDIAWEGQVSRNGQLTESSTVDPGSRRAVRCTRKVFERARKQKSAVLLCNSQGTALAEGSDIPDESLVRWLQGLVDEGTGL